MNIFDIKFVKEESHSIKLGLIINDFTNKVNDFALVMNSIVKRMEDMSNAYKTIKIDSLPGQEN